MVRFACTRVEADMTVAITRMGRTAAELRRYAACSADASVARRLLALALVLDGHKREDAARAAGSPKRLRRLRLGPADLVRLGAPLQRGRHCRLGRPA